LETKEVRRLFNADGGRLQVYALVDFESDGVADKLVTVLSGLDQPNGVAWRNGALYVAEVGRVTRYDNADWYVLNNKVRHPHFTAKPWRPDHHSIS
jgi:hypothetical protein